jgi:hypothetical protein
MHEPGALAACHFRSLKEEERLQVAVQVSSLTSSQLAGPTWAPRLGQVGRDAGTQQSAIADKCRQLAPPALNCSATRVPDMSWHPQHAT